MRAPATLPARAVAVGLAVLPGLAAQARARVSADAGAAAGGEGARFSIFLGAFGGMDSNIARERPGEEDRDNLTELLGGLAYTFRGNRKRFELRYQTRSDSYSGLSEHDYEESRAFLSLGVVSEKTRFRAEAEYASLVEPTDMEISYNLERTQVSFLPKLDLRLGRTELGLVGSVRSVRHDDDTFEYWDRDDSALRMEVRRRIAAEHKQQLFVHIGLGGTDFGPGRRTDLDHTRTYVGWRSEEPGKSGIEVGAGTDTVDSRRVSSESNPFGLVRYHSAASGRKGRSALEVAYVRSAEAAATADYKTASTFLVRYMQAPKSRLSWSIGITSERAELVNPDVSAAGSLFWLSVDAAAQLDFGRANAARGRFYASITYEMRRGDSDEHEYYRTRAVAGLAFVY